MKKLFLLLAILLVPTIGACGMEQQASASLPEGFKRVSFDEDIGGHYTDASVVKHIDTGCYYIVVRGYEGEAVGITQMHVQGLDGSKPYCD